LFDVVPLWTDILGALLVFVTVVSITFEKKINSSCKKENPRDEQNAAAYDTKVSIGGGVTNYGMTNEELENKSSQDNKFTKDEERKPKEKSTESQNIPVSVIRTV